MKNWILFFAIAFFSVGILNAQQGDEQKIKKFEEKLNDAKLLKQLAKARLDAEVMVSRLKLSGIEEEDIKIAYAQTQVAYNAIIDSVLTDIDEVETIGSLVDHLIKRKTLRKKYRKMLKDANKEHMLPFQEMASSKLKDEKFLGAVIDWIVDFLPGYVKKISDESIEAVKKILNDKFNELKLRDWEAI